MKGPIGIALLLIVASSALEPLTFQPSSVYVYEAESSLLTGIPDVENQYSGLSLSYKVVFSVQSPGKVGVQLKDIRSAKLNDELPASYQEDIDFHHTPSAEYAKELSKPLVVYYKNGVIDKFEAESDDDTWSVNIKKAILTNFQLDLTKSGDAILPRGQNKLRTIHPEALSFKLFEDGIGGECETRYNIFSVQSLDHPDMSEDVYNITKVKNYRNCNSRTKFEKHNYDVQGCPEVCQSHSSRHSPLENVYSDDASSEFATGCPYGFQPDFHPVKSFGMTKYNVSRASHQPIIEDIYNEGKTVYSFNGDEIIVVVQQNFTLISVKPLKSPLAPLRRPETHEDLSYEMPIDETHSHLEFSALSIFGPLESEELVELVVKKLEDAAEDIIPDDPSTSEWLGTKIIELNNAVMAMKQVDLDKVVRHLAKPRPGQRTDRKLDVMRSIFLDVLTTAGTNAAARLSLQLIKEKRVSKYEAVELIEGISKNLQHPEPDVIRKYLELLSAPTVVQDKLGLFGALAVGFGDIVDQACVSPKLVPNSDPFQNVVAKVNRTASAQPQKPQHSRSARNQQSSEEEDEQDDQQQQSDMAGKSKRCTSEHLLEYIREIVQRLNKEKNLNKMVAYIRALGHMSTPMVLEHLEPFLKGEAPILEDVQDEDVEFIKSVAIYALHEVNDYYPEPVLPLAVEIYFDDDQSYEIRIAAFTVIMESRPGLVLLERIASELWDENNNQVLSFVVSHLQDIANSTEPCKRKLSQKVQIILEHAPTDDADDLGIQYSNTYAYDFYDDDRDYGMNAKLRYVASNVSNIPRRAVFELNHIDGPFQDETLRLAYNAKGLDELLDKIIRPGGVLSQILSQMGSNVQTHNLDHVLDIVKNKLVFSPRSEEIPRAVVSYNLFGRETTLSMDEKFILRIVEDVVRWVREMDPTTGVSSHYVKVWMPASFFKMVPSTLGLPVVINKRHPIVFSLVLENVRISSGDRKEVPLDSSFAVSTILRPSLHWSTVVLAYAVSAPEDLLYGVGYEKVYEVSLPMVVTLAVDLKKDTYALSLKPKLPHQVASHFARPTTFQSKAVLIDVSKSEWLGEVNEIETIPESIKLERHLESRSLGVVVRVQAETESPWADTPFWLSGTAYEDGVVPALVELLKHPGLEPREYHLYLEPHVEEPASEFVITVDYDREISFHAPVQGQSQESEEAEQEQDNNEDDDEEDIFEPYDRVLSNIYGNRYEAPTAQKTIEQLIKKTKPTWSPVLGGEAEDDEPVPATISHILGVTTVVKGTRPKQFAFKVTYAHTLDHRSIWLQINGHKSSLAHQKPWQLCADVVVAFPPQPNPFYLEMNALHAQSAKLRADLGWGMDCSRDNQIVVLGSMEKSEEQLTSSSNVYLESGKGDQSLPWYFHQCQVHRSEGETQSYACQLAISEAAQLNKLELEIVADKLSPWSLNQTNKLELALKSYLYPNLEVNPLVSNPESTLRIVVETIDQIPDVDLTNVYIYKPTENIFFTRLNTPYYTPVSSMDTIEDIYGDILMGGEYNPSCNLMEDYVQTFDNVTFELPDNKCQYVLVKDCSPDSSFTILVSQVDLEAKTKAVSISIAGHVIKMLPPRGAHVPVIIDDKELSISSSRPYVADFNKDTEIYLYVKETVGSTDTPILVLRVSDEDLSIEYDGKNAEVQVPRSYKGDTCGLCGDYNDEDFWEFTGPRGCTYVDEEDFANSYAIPGQSCPVAPKPKGAAFCPDAKQQRNTIEKEESSDEDDEEDEQPSRQSKQASKPIASSRQAKVAPSRDQPAKSHQQVAGGSHRTKPRAQDDEIVLRPNRRQHEPSHHQRRQQPARPQHSEEESEEQDQQARHPKRRTPNY